MYTHTYLNQSKANGGTPCIGFFQRKHTELPCAVLKTITSFLQGWHYMYVYMYMTYPETRKDKPQNNTQQKFKDGKIIS